MFLHLQCTEIIGRRIISLWGYNSSTCAVKGVGRVWRRAVGSTPSHSRSGSSSHAVRRARSLSRRRARRSWRTMHERRQLTSWAAPPAFPSLPPDHASRASTSVGNLLHAKRNDHLPSSASSTASPPAEPHQLQALSVSWSVGRVVCITQQQPSKG